EEFPDAQAVLLAVTADEEDYDGFKFCAWKALCIRMRKLAVQFCNEGKVTQAAMILSFVAAVEQNLLGYSAEAVREVSGGRVAFLNSVIVDHVEEFVKLED